MSRTSRLRRAPPIGPPSASFRSLVLATLCFFSLIAAFIGVTSFGGSSSSSNNNNKHNNLKNNNSHNTKMTKVRFDTPQEIPDDIVHLDAILVLGGGVPKSMDEPPIFTQRRCDDAAQVVQRRDDNNNNASSKGLPILCLSAGTAHLPQFISQDGLPVWEATSSAAYLLSKYADLIDKSQVYVETTSYDTISNAFFARTSFTDISGWRKLLVITNEVCLFVICCYSCVCVCGHENAALL